MPRPVAALAALLLAAAACEDAPPPRGCAETGVCAPGEVCDRTTGVCRPGRESPPELSDVGRWLSAAAGPDGTVYWAARAESPGALVAGRVHPGAEEVELEVVVEGTGAGLGTSVAVGPDGLPRIAFFDAAAGALRLARFNGTNWEVEQVDRGTPEVPLGEDPALSFDASGAEVVAYRDAGAGGLKVAVRQGSDWSRQVVDRPEEGPGPRGGRGFASAIAMAGGRPLIAHYDADGGDLRVVVPDEGGWSVRVFGDPADPATGGSDPDWGRFVDATTDPLGNVGLAFFDASAGQLVVAWNERGTLHLETADDGRGIGEPRRVVGAIARLAFDHDGRPVAAYQDGAQASLKLAVRDPEGWSRRVLDDTPVSGQGIALVVASTGELVLLHRRLDVDADGVRGRLLVVRP